MKKTFLNLLFLFQFFVSFAQTNHSVIGKISGKIVDSISNSSIPYATIRLINQENNKIISGTSTKEDGTFELTQIPLGKYFIIIDFIGYQKKIFYDININSAKYDIVFPTFKLKSNQHSLNEVIISGEKSIIENKIDKTVYNVDKDITSQSGVATDVLKKIPQVSVDVDGNVELQGNASIRFLIDGKPSILYGNSISDVLQAIPSSQIQSIEIITSPGAKYDAEGTGGIINIILKKNKQEGINGNIALSIGTRLENGSFNLNFRKKKIAINFFLSGNAQLKSITKNSLNRNTQYTDTISNLIQNGQSNFNRNGYQSGLGLDWTINARNNLTANINFNHYENENIGTVNRNIQYLDNNGYLFSNENDILNNSNNFHNNSIDIGISYIIKFEKENHELNFSYNSSFGNFLSQYQQSQINESTLDAFNSSKGNNPDRENETYFSIDYSNPISKKAIIETGFKGTYDYINSNSQVSILDLSNNSYSLDNSQASGVDYNRFVYAAYLSAKLKLLNYLDIVAGCRDEYTTTTASFLNTQNASIPPYNSLVPSIIIAHNFSKNQMLKFSYSRRIERPDYRDLNPFLNASDPQNITTGNPNIRPEIGDKFELNYGINKNGISINAGLSVRRNKDDIQPYTRFYPTFIIGDSTYTNVSIAMRENIGHENNYGLNIFVSFPLWDKLNIRANISCYERYIFTGISNVGDVHGLNYRSNMNISYEAPKKIFFEFFGNFNSSRINAQGKMPSFTTYNFAIKKQLLNNKASIALSATNFLNKYVNQKTTLNGDNFTLNSTRLLPYQSFGINFTYKFGKLNFKKEKQNEDTNLTNPPDNDN